MRLGFNEIDLQTLKAEEYRAWDLWNFSVEIKYVFFLHGLTGVPLMEVIIKSQLLGGIRGAES